MFALRTPQGGQVFSFDESAGTVQVCVVLVSGTVSQNTVVAVESDQPGDTATGTDVIVNVERGSIQYYYRENIVQTFFFCS